LEKLFRKWKFWVFQLEKSCAFMVWEKIRENKLKSSLRCPHHRRHVMRSKKYKKEERKIYDKDYVKISLWNDNKKEYNAQGSEWREWKLYNKYKLICP
jgi:hypothetical protein